MRCPKPSSVNTTSVQPVVSIINLSNHINIPNLKAQNYVLSPDQTIYDVYKQLFQSKSNWTFCPLDKPFLIGNSQ